MNMSVVENHNKLLVLFIKRGISKNAVSSFVNPQFSIFGINQTGFMIVHNMVAYVFACFHFFRAFLTNLAKIGLLARSK